MSGSPTRSQLLGFVVALALLGAVDLLTGALSTVAGLSSGSPDPVVHSLANATLGLALLLAVAGLYLRLGWARPFGLLVLAAGSAVRALPLVRGEMPPLLGLIVYSAAFLYLLLGADLIDDEGGTRGAEEMDPHQLRR